MPLPKWFQILRNEPSPEMPDFDTEANIEYLEAGDRVWIEFAPEWDSWDGQPTYCAGELVFTNPAEQRGFVVYLNHHNLISHGWFPVERVYSRKQTVSFDRPDTDAGRSATERKARMLSLLAGVEIATAAHPAEAEYAAV
jgi:hypothetical protein